MSHPTKGVDHCFVLVDDLDAAAQDYAKMGFTLSAKGLHSETKGTANYTIMFKNDYLELLGFVAETDLNQSRRDHLRERGQGLHAIACRIDNAEEAAKRLADLGIATEDLGSFERPVSLPDGTTAPAAFSTVSYTAEETPRGKVFMCQHKTRETVWIPELLDHANTAVGLGGILAISDDPASEAPRFARLWADGKITQEGGAYRIETSINSAPLTLMPRATLQELYPDFDLDRTPNKAFTVLQIKVADLAATRACLAASGLTASNTQAGIALPPQDGAGTIMEFIPS